MAEVLAEGFNVFDTAKSPLLVRGGTTTFLAPALSMRAIGVITLSGGAGISPGHSVPRVPRPRA